MCSDGKISRVVLDSIVAMLASALEEDEGACSDDEEGDANADRKADNDAAV